MTHRHAFTLYPAGWFPYSRRPVAVRSTDWTKTIFVAAVCTAAGKLWPEELAGDYGHRATSQRRFIEACGEWLELDQRERAQKWARPHDYLREVFLHQLNVPGQATLPVELV